MSYQKCPVCNGSGYLIDAYATPKCHVCRGWGIISEVTGMPPNGVKNTVETVANMIVNTEDFGDAVRNNHESFF